LRHLFKGTRRWAVILGIWTAYGLLSSAQQVLSSQLGGRPMPWSLALELQIPLAMIWALATPGILWLGRRFPFHAGGWKTGVLVHLAACLTFIFLLDLWYAWHASRVLPGIGSGQTLLSGAFRLFIVWILTDGLLYWTVLSVGYAVDHYLRYRERELASAQLETQLLQADLRALRMQLHPHFLFNALHTIGALVRTGDQKNAVRVTAGLGALLRRMLDEARDQLVPLQQELDFIRSYLEIEQLRFADRLTIDLDIDPSVVDALVPQFILQPLVENAIRHGVAPHRAAGRVVVEARSRDDRLRLSVRDDGPGLPAGEPAEYRIGLSNTQARLTALYGNESALVVRNAPGRGLEAMIEIPWRPVKAGIPAGV
jgi:two-component system, LytTR family, sensor kinase